MVADDTTSQLRRRGHDDGNSPGPDGSPSREGLKKTDTVRTIGFLKLRGKTDDLPQNWWFASTAVPLLAATQGPLSNVLSIAALVTAWRLELPNNGQLPEGADDNGIPLKDPGWELALNGVSLACGFAGNLLLLLHFVGRVRYIVALPLSIIFWLLASGILIAVTTSGFWHAVLASITYMFGAVMLIANLLGYLLGHYPQNFVLDDDQRTLILQTLSFFAWLAGGAAIFSSLEGWSFANALYYCDVSVLTIGYGDLAPTTDAARGFFFVYELVGITQLGLVISRLSKYMSSISADKVIRKHQARARENTIDRTVTSEKELRERLGLPQQRKSSVGNQMARRNSLAQYGQFQLIGDTVTFRKGKSHRDTRGRHKRPLALHKKVSSRALRQVTHHLKLDRKNRILVLKEEQDRFNAMRNIQDETKRFKQYYTLVMAVFAFALLWCVGALVFMWSEARMQDLSYFDSFYFCFVTLLTVGYGDVSPKSNVGKPFFIVWSLIAVPSLTVLIQAMSDTVVAGVNRATNVLLPEKGFLKAFIESHQNHWITRLLERRQEQRRVDAGFQVQDPDEAGAADSGNLENANMEVPKRDTSTTPTSRAGEDNVDEHNLARQLATAIRTVARDLQADPPKRYSYEEWAHFTKLIRFSSGAGKDAVEAREEEEGLVEWDWIGEDSPLLSDSTESEWVLDRLCESLNRYTRWNSRRHGKGHRHVPTDTHPAAIDETVNESNFNEKASYAEEHRQ
ncbi:Uu.00g049740.m01.CDS01 [Anthostomella pinea]|uniref:Uu.00g049740.m01.CDS01 n=1 Tax=Anthostomella pinea TaxID=933095 RepID=A0AAI8VCZ4_9PEZI|nr:Uu.00g049740.m01.CDS01 [Anthostomella pinea]